MTWRAVVSCLSLSLEWGGHGPMVVVAKERKRLTEKKYGGTERVCSATAYLFHLERIRVLEVPCREIDFKKA